MAAPLIERAEGSEELRFTGKDGFGEERNNLELLMEAFAHSSVWHSRSTVLVADIQGM